MKSNREKIYVYREYIGVIHREKESKNQYWIIVYIFH